MAATDLTAIRGSASDGRRITAAWPLCGLARSWLTVYVAVWIGMLSFAAFLALNLAGMDGLARHLLGLRLDAERNPPPRIGHVLVLAAHNLPIVAWPLLLGVVGTHRHRVARLLTDIVVAGWVTANVLPVGVALGAYGAPLLPYLPQVPFECAALALGASGWLLQRHRPLTITAGLTVFVALTAIVLSAATLETVAVPHRRQSNQSDTTTESRSGPTVPAATQIIASRTIIWIETFVPSIVKDD